ncbi:acyl-CoA dehydrogenase family protein [Actinomadura sp. KC345]|uniref:acyl-CoA dehydrogenase family protein n=1 Tax=Actinomadura sp. KC345 TaxID=2530371 RepID=UPI0014053564|nr:acyl-CoA dehydrogenase family protein [Actinomadura sp. KC345]
MTPEHLEFRDLARKYFGEKAAIDPLAEPAEAGAIRRWWRRADEELGLGGSFLSEEAGGLGLDFGFAAVLLEEAGRILLDAPLLPVVVASQALRGVDPVAAGQVLRPGAAVGVALGGTDWMTAPTPRVDRSGAAPAVTGDLGLVLHGQSLDVVLIPAVDAGGEAGVYAVETADPGYLAVPVTGVDLRREAARVRLEAAPAVRVPGPGDAAPHLRRVGEVAAIALALEQVGAGQAALEMAVDYARTRVQFGRPIGSFQAIKHRCAEMLIDVERARSAAYHAVGQVVADADLAEPAALAQATASEALDRIAYENVQVHGGVGFTWEHPAHLYARRATSTRALLGGPETHRDRLVTALRQA